MTAALSIVSAVALTTALTFYTSNTKAQSTPSLSGSCGFVLTTQTWGWIPVSGNTYDAGLAYGVFNFDTKKITYAVSQVKVNNIGNNPGFSEKEESVGFKVVPHPTIPSTFKIVYVDAAGVEAGDYTTVVATNGGNTFLMAGYLGDSAGVCQKI